jgi:uncharacterized protein YjaG (DUF416 family)
VVRYLLEQEDHEERLSRVSSRHRASFAAACAERLLPCYETFVDHAGWGDVERLREGLDTAWTFAAGEAVERPGLRALRKACLEATPDTEDFGSPIGTSAARGRRRTH